MKRILPLLLLLAALSACSLPQARTATPQPSQVPAPTASETPAPTLAPTLAPTEAPLPTATLGALPTPTWEPGCPPPNLIYKLVPQNFSMPDLVGTAFFDSPAGVQFESGWLINMDNPEVFALETVLFESQRYLLLERIVCNEPGGKAFYLVLDVLPYPELAPDESLGIDVVCALGGVREEKILAVAQVPENLLDQPQTDLGYQLGSLRLAWLANLQTGKFEPVSTDGIQCYMPWMGD